ncbi:protein LLP homolog [Drosophila grimshawi]|uniref:GH15813 n=1 Tax=Drosophila grimshawi TaxID=7222 RepID=B4IZN9_DROGR|nr:protein LLP homolog [Drosophila grimshawi]EDV95624.1 GH15813 [Drosophila grimshawi]
MGRSNRSRKRRDEMNKIKKDRYDAKELIRLKKTLGLLDADGKEIKMEIGEVAEIKSAKDIKKAAKTREHQELIYEHQESLEKGKEIFQVNEKTGVEHVYNSKTLKDQFGNYPAWFKKKKTAKRLRKKQHAQKKNFKQAWTTVNVPL